LLYFVIETYCLFISALGLIPALKKRLVDTNKNLTVLALNILGDLATAVGPAIESQMKFIATAILNNFSVWTSESVDGLRKENTTSKILMLFLFLF
jgi:hypothetical protein